MFPVFSLPKYFFVTTACRKAWQINYNAVKHLPADHDEVSEVDDSYGGGDEEVASATEMSFVQQRGQCKGDCSSQSAVR